MRGTSVKKNLDWRLEMKAWDNLRKSFKIAILTVLCITMVFSTGLLYMISYGASDKSSSKSSKQTESAKTSSVTNKVQAPEINAKSAVLYSENTNTVVFSKNKNERVAPFSTTKLMTALLVVKHIKNLDQKVTISKEAAALGGSSMETISLQLRSRLWSVYFQTEFHNF